jgi:hypothetical protein
MLEHARSESEVRSLSRGKPKFGEQRGNQWNARDRPKRMCELVVQHLGDVPQLAAIRQVLAQAIQASDLRNFLAHGEWWRLEQTGRMGARDFVTSHRLTLLQSRIRSRISKQSCTRSGEKSRDVIVPSHRHAPIMGESAARQQCGRLSAPISSER